MPAHQPTISVFFPCYNDQYTISKLVKTAFLILPTIARKYEVIVIDDGSTDGSRKILQRLTKQFPLLRVVYHDHNQGYGGALQTGFRIARYDWLFYTDGDGQYRVDDLSVLARLMDRKTDFVNGIKIARQDATYRIFIGNIYSFVVRWMFWSPISDVDCDYRLIRRSIIKKIQLNSTSGSICVELVKKSQRAGARFREVSVHHYSRKWGHSQFFRPKRLLMTFFEISSIWMQLMIFRQSEPKKVMLNHHYRSHKPLVRV